jgi:hypothetical protein
MACSGSGRLRGAGVAEEFADLGPGEFLVAGVAAGWGRSYWAWAMRLAKAWRWTVESPSQ